MYMTISCQFLVICQKLCNQTYKCIKNSIKNILIYIHIDPVPLIEEL